MPVGVQSQQSIFSTNLHKLSSLALFIFSQAGKVRTTFEVTVVCGERKRERKSGKEREMQHWRLIKCKLLSVSLPICIILFLSCGFADSRVFGSTFFLTMPLQLILIKRYEDRLKTTASDYIGMIA